MGEQRRPKWETRSSGESHCALGRPAARIYPVKRDGGWLVYRPTPLLELESEEGAVGLVLDTA